MNHFLLNVVSATDEIKKMLARHLDPKALTASDHSSQHSHGGVLGSFGNLQQYEITTKLSGSLENLCNYIAQVNDRANERVVTKYLLPENALSS